MRTTIEKDFRLEAAHFLPNVPEGHKCRRMHGHSFVVTVTVSGEVDPAVGWIVDFADLTAAWQSLHDLLDHRVLNDVAGLENPTSERLAAFIAERLALPARARLEAVTVHETCTARARVTTLR